MATSDKHLKPVPHAEIKACALACADWLVRKGFAKRPKSTDELILFLHPPGWKETRDEKGALITPKRSEAEAMPPPGTHAETSKKAYAVRAVFTWLWLTVLPSIERRRAAATRRRAPKALRDHARSEDWPTLADKTIEQEVSARWRRHVASASDFESEIGKLAKRQDQRADYQIRLGIAPGLVEHSGQALLLAFRKCLDQMSGFQRTIDLLLGIPISLENLSESGLAASQPTAVERLTIPHSREGWTDCRVQLERWLREQRFTYPEIATLLPGRGDGRAVMQRLSRRKAAKKGK